MKSEKNIENFISKFNSNSILTDNKEIYEPFHIFYKLIDYFGIKQDKNKFMTSYYKFVLIDMCLNLTRRRDLNSAKFIYDNIKLDINEIDSKIQSGILSLYYAMVSYLEFIENNSDKADELLDKAISNARCQSETFNDFLSSVQEQWLNKVRIYIRDQKRDKIIEQSKKLFAFSLFGADEDNTITKRFETLPNSVHQLMLYYTWS
jgi:vacuolar-type H+-ATPase subunit H